MANRTNHGSPRDMTNARAAKAAKAERNKDERGLTPKERAFVLHYLGAGRCNLTESAVLAGYGKSGREAARVIGHQVFQRPRVMAEIERLTAERNERLKVTADDVLRDLVILKTDAELLPKQVQTIKARREILKDIGEHVSVGAFRRHIGLSAPNGGPIETIDVAALANLSDEELEQLERARAILDRVAGKPAPLPDGGSDTGGEGTAPESA